MTIGSVVDHQCAVLQEAPLVTMSTAARPHVVEVTERTTTPEAGDIVVVTEEVIMVEEDTMVEEGVKLILEEQ